MRILVTGGRGQLGMDCQEVFAGHEVLALDLPNLDITDGRSVDGVLDLWKPDAVVNCAAYTAVDRAESDEATALKVNADGPGLLAERAAARGIRLVQISTDYVFDGERAVPQPYVESDATGPTGAYGRTKLEGEKRVAAAGGRWAILRTSWLYGRNGNNFPKTILKHALRNPEKGLKVVDDQTGTPTWSRRLAEQIKVVLEAGAEGLFHATGEGHCTWWAFAKEFLALMGVACEVRPCRSEEYPTPTKRPANSILENAALKAAGLNAMRDWREDLAEYVGRYKEGLLAEVRGG